MAEPRLVGPKGELKLTDLKWKTATAGWGNVNVNANWQGRPLHAGTGVSRHRNALTTSHRERRARS